MFRMPFDETQRPRPRISKTLQKQNQLAQGIYMENNSKFWREIKALVIFLASGAFIKVHKEFMKPSQEMFDIHHWTSEFHHWCHFFIGAALQVIFVFWLLRIIWYVLLHPIYSYFRHKDKDVPMKSTENGRQ